MEAAVRSASKGLRGRSAWSVGVGRALSGSAPADVCISGWPCFTPGTVTGFRDLLLALPVSGVGVLRQGREAAVRFPCSERPKVRTPDS